MKYFLLLIPLSLSLLLKVGLLTLFLVFFFNFFNRCNENSLSSCFRQLDNLAISSLENPTHALIIIDTSVKNNVATSITHIHIHNKPIVKILHHIVNVNIIEAKLFAIRCSINQATLSLEISKIVVITNSIHAAKKIFDPTLHSFQIYTSSILCKLQKFFNIHQDNLIEFWECLSRCNWLLYKAVNKKTKSFNSSSHLPYKSLWDFSKKNKCDNISNMWRMIFQSLNLKGRQFLKLCNNNNNSIEPSYVKGGI